MGLAEVENDGNERLSSTAKLQHAVVRVSRTDESTEKVRHYANMKKEKKRMKCRMQVHLWNCSLAFAALKCL